MKKNLIIAFAALLVVACSAPTQKKTETHEATETVARGIYHWKTTYNPTEWEKQWMKRHRVDRLYVKLFEVDVGSKHGYDDWPIVPVATTRFDQPLPKDVEVVPVVYITVDAIRAMRESFIRYEQLIVERIYAMMGEHYGGTVHEVQLDCDWTSSTRYDYFQICYAVESELRQRKAILSGTVRLHQLNDDQIPFERKLLMCYNTGRLQDYKTHNSILDHDDVKPYLQKFDGDTLRDYNIAWPAYGWGVQFDDKKRFVRLTKPKDGKHTRVEWGEPKEVAQVKKSLPPMQANTVILYHLDEENLKHYTDEEIEAMYSPRADAR